ncbi:MULTISPECIES: tetratricopeptide repeat protein [unclassified Streptomyces]|uniref:tetratricopeptide repeat protein n=1 Tax=unclassified Streptomyces TaxID=2593676 RepID=UPI002885CD73|nr:tetratricopeptide repeat protein [Streptomyces sp. DSM 41633]
MNAQVLAGMGGVGKTQLAADHARRAWENGEVDLLVWVTAATRQAIIDAYAQAAADILHADPTDPERAAQAFLAWLEPKPTPQACRWLIVLDDVADPGDLRGLWPPAHALGRTLLTTRRRDAALTTHAQPVLVGLFTPDEATTYLQQALAAHGRRDNNSTLGALAADLGHLPLALSQAAAYLIDTHLDAASYRVHLADRARQLADLLPEPGTLPDDQPTSAAAAWSLSLDRADQLRPVGLARPMLQLTAMLDPNGIPQAALTSEPTLSHLAANRTTQHDRGSTPTPRAITAESAIGALRILHRLSLIDHTPDEPHQAVRIHQLIQRATRDALDLDHQSRLARTAADALTAAWPEVERDTELARALRANTTALIACSEDGLYRPDVHVVLYRLGLSFAEAGQVTSARQHFQQLTTTTTHHLGPDHINTLTARSNLAHWRGEAGDPTGAAAEFAAVLKDRLRVLGPEHPDTLTTRSNLAIWQARTGDLAGAVAACTAMLETSLQVLGPDHPHNLSTRNNLTNWRGEAGDPAGAAVEFVALLEDRLQVLGPNHPDTLLTRANLASWLGEAGDPAGAAAAYTAALKDFVRVLGPDHPRTLTTRINFANWRGEAGDPAGAAAECAAVLEDRLRVLGPDHPDIFMSRVGLVYWLWKAGNPAGTAAACAAALDDRLRVLGPEAPHANTARNTLAIRQGQTRDLAWAGPEFATAVRDFLSLVLAQATPTPSPPETTLPMARARDEARNTAGDHPQSGR